MVLMHQEEVIKLLVCPATGARLRRDIDGFVSLASPPKHYKVWNGLPVLIDYDDSVVDNRMDYGSSVPRILRTGIGGFLKRLVSSSPLVTARNVRRFVHCLDSLRPRPGRRKVLVVGGGTLGNGVQQLYDNPGIEIVGFDVYATPLVHFIADAHNIPLPNASVDGVLVQAVLECVLDPTRVVAEIHRVLCEDGLVYAETPFLQAVGEGAYDFTRFTESGHRFLFRQFERITSGALNGPGTASLGIADALIRGLLRSYRAGKAAKVLLFWMKYLDLLVPQAYQIDAASGVFFLGRKSPHSMSPKAAIAHYLGSQT